MKGAKSIFRNSFRAILGLLLLRSFSFFLAYSLGWGPSGRQAACSLYGEFSSPLAYSSVSFSCRGFRWSDPILGILAARPWNFSKPWMKVEVNKVRLVSCFSLFLSSRIAFM